MLVADDKELDAAIEKMVRLTKAVKITEMKEIDTDKPATVEEFSYKECRGPHHKSPKFFVDQIFTDFLDFHSDSAIQVSFAKM
jgi:hypothetical protein